MTDPVSRTMLLLDIERFSHRDDVEQAYLRRMLYDVVEPTLESTGADGTGALRADRGDGLMVLIDANIPLTRVLRTVLVEIPARLHAVNRMASATARMRLRGVVAVGQVAVDPYDGWVGSDLNLACRLLDADPLRAALAARADDFALCVSAEVHSGVVRHGHPGIPTTAFHPMTVPSKNGPLAAWLYGAPPQDTPASTPEPAPAPAAEGGAREQDGRARDGADGGRASADGQAPAGTVMTVGDRARFGGSMVGRDLRGVGGDARGPVPSPSDDGTGEPE
ncbi:hypothetical protein [Streptomyces sp. NPDC050560]|uniref:hypothetical protein n=1 Tax=Streptomyces sp. NPDC050560 TaxID=3365630 RepID=UPI0037AB55D5